MRDYGKLFFNRPSVRAIDFVIVQRCDRLPDIITNFKTYTNAFTLTHQGTIENNPFPYLLIAQRGDGFTRRFHAEFDTAQDLISILQSTVLNFPSGSLLLAPSHGISALLRGPATCFTHECSSANG